jgi:hypothetical protein
VNRGESRGGRYSCKMVRSPSSTEDLPVGSPLNRTMQTPFRRLGAETVRTYPERLIELPKKDVAELREKSLPGVLFGTLSVAPVAARDPSSPRAADTLRSGVL